MVSTSMKFTHVSAGLMYSCAIAVGGAAFCWGGVSGDSAIGASHLGNSSFSGYYGANQGSLSPVPVEGGFHFSDISAGASSTCALTTDGKAMCWGSNNFGQLGVATMSMNFTTAPRAVRMPASVIAPARGELHSCGLTTSGRIWCWGGFNFFGELGSSPVSRPGVEANIRPTPAPIDSLPR
jgi:alpha-tubulin suppressor-like RCC1 family protein